MNDKLIPTHARWRDRILTHQITGVHHIPGCLNVVADSLSQASKGQTHQKGDRSEWTISKDWETTIRLTHDIFHMAEAQSSEMAKLQDLFKDEPIFVEVIDALLELDQGVSLWKQKRACHQASEYMITEGKLWHIAGSHKTQAQPKVECVTRKEAEVWAKEEHLNNRHWQ